MEKASWDFEQEIAQIQPSHSFKRKRVIKQLISTFRCLNGCVVQKGNFCLSSQICCISVKDD